MASVLNRTTKQFLVSVNTPEYSTADWIHNPDMSPVAGVLSRYWVIEGDTVREMTDTEKDTNHLVTCQQEKMDEFDVRTDELIAAGFTYSGLTFSLSMPAQAKIIGTHVADDDNDVTYPIKWNSIDDLNTYELLASSDIHNFYTTAFDAVRDHLDSGTTLKDSVRAETTASGVNAVTDTR